MNREEKNILILSNSPKLYFGYSVVFSEVAKNLSDAGYNVYYQSMQDFGQPIEHENYTLLGMRYSWWGEDSLEDYIKLFDIDVVITALDLWMPKMKFINEIMERNPFVKWIPHITINTIPAPIGLIQNTQKAEHIVAPSLYVKNIYDQVGVINKGAKYIPHFVDLNIFYPKDKSKVEYLKESLDLGDEFKFVSVMRNRDFHKNYAALFKAYRMAIMECPEMKTKTKMVVICDPKESNGINLLTLRSLTGLEENVIFPYQKLNTNWKDIKDKRIIPTRENDPEGIRYSTSIAFTREIMSDIYNLCDVHVSSSSGESFGLPILESMACGLPQICNLATTGKELVEETKSGIAVPPAYNELVASMADIQLIDIIGLKEAMIKLYKDSEFREKCSKNGIEAAKEYDKKDIMKVWVEFIDEIINIKKGGLGL